MAKKKVDIVKQLNSLNPGVPTRTRQKRRSDSVKTERESKFQSPGNANEKQITTSPFGFAEMFFRNISSMETFRSSIVEDALRFQSLFFASWSRNYGIFCDAIRANFYFTGAK